MFVDIDKVIDFCVEHKITIEQYTFCYILYLDMVEGTKYDKQAQLYNDSGPHISNVYKYVQVPKGSEERKNWRLADVGDLVEKGFIVDRNSSKSTGRKEAYPDNYDVTDKFVDAIFAGESSFEEFWEEYPYFTKNFDRPHSGPKIPLKSCDKDQLEKKYFSKVTSQSMHNRVMKALRYAKERGEIKMSIVKWVGGEYWKPYLEELSETTSGTIKQNIV